MPWIDFFGLYGLVLAAILFGAFVARASGVGFALLLVAALLALPHLDQPTVLFLVAPLSILNLGLVSALLYRATPWPELRILALPIFVGVLIGFLLGLVVDKAWVLVFGLIVVAYNIWTMVQPAPAGSGSAMARPLIGGGLTGLMTGALSFPGPPISAYMLARGHRGDAIRMTVAATGLAAALMRLGIGGPFMTWRPEFWQVLACGVVLIFLGNMAGTWAASRIRPRVHRLLIITLTLIAFLYLAWGLARELSLA